MACREQVAVMLLVMAAVLLLCLSPQAADARTLKRKKIPTFQVYNFLATQGPNSTQGYNAVRCGHPTTSPPNQFGDIYCFDMPLLKKKDPASELLGRVQGTFTISQLTGGRVFVTETFILNGTSLAFKGSFSALGIENIGLLSSKPITGGTEDYELVTGNAFTTPLGGISFDQFGNAIFWFKYKFVFDNSHF